VSRRAAADAGDKVELALLFLHVEMMSFLSEALTFSLF
jgi:hypothetical protein